MANIKDLFAIYKNQKVLASKSLGGFEQSVESAGWIGSTIKLQNEFEPIVNYSSASSFARYGSAEQYYEDSFSYILNEYPYDGSDKEKINWEITSSGLDKYIFENEYPRTNGYITIGTNYGGVIPAADFYDTSPNLEYIFFKGGPHPSPGSSSGVALSKYFDSTQGATPAANFYNEQTNQQSNLEIDGGRGIALEFWLHKQDFNEANESRRQIVFDIWNSGSWGTNGYGRFRVELSGATTTLEPSLFVELMSGTSGFSSRPLTFSPPTIEMSASAFTGSWNHFALSFVNTGSGPGAQMEGRLHQNGKLVYTVVTGSAISLVTGSMIGQIGSLITEVEGVEGSRGAGKLSGSLDELRFWKKHRTSEQIGQNWFTQIYGGTNTDWTHENNAATKYSFTNPVDLGVYYKFNEGIINSSSTNEGDTNVLDYSGRITNGTWTGYSVGARNTGSAMVIAEAAASEFKDPILYSYHPEVSSKLSFLKTKGAEYDVYNNASIFQSIPSWIQDEDLINDRKVLLRLTQIIASYFDNLHLRIENLPRIKDIEYISGSHKPYPFVNRSISAVGLTPAELFTNADAFEALANRDDFREFAQKLDDTKNKIYQNIYNNLVYVFKSKGTAKAIRNLIRCYGIGDEIVKLNLYGNEITHDIRDNFESSITRKQFANFHNTASFGASVYQSASLIDPNVRGFLTGGLIAGGLPEDINPVYNGITMQAEIIFPQKSGPDSPGWFPSPSVSCSLFGFHEHGNRPGMGPNPPAPAWYNSDTANLQVYFVRTESEGVDGYFLLQGTPGTVVPFPMTSSVIKDVYENSNWNVSVRIKPRMYPWSGSFAPPTNATPEFEGYDVEFTGYNTVLDSVDQQFKVVDQIPITVDGQEFLSATKQIYAGAHRYHFTGTLIEPSDAKISSVRFWFDYLSDQELLAHAKDPSNFGRTHPGRNAFLNQLGHNFAENITQVPEIETLALQWNFDQVTGSNALGEFVVGDYSSGSATDALLYGWIGPLTGLQHPGKGINFPPNNTMVAPREYVYTAKQQHPEVLNSDNMVELRTQDDDVIVRDTRPMKYFFSVEKSMYSIISTEMIKLFATVLDFNNLIGEPVNRYRQDYKALEKMRQLFFERVENDTIDFERFIDYFKWIDESIGKMASQLFPASANFSEKVFNMIESHVLERNKYWNKFPTLEMQPSDPEAGLRGINEMLYPYARGSAPIPLVQDEHCVWAHNRASGSTFSSGDSDIDAQRDIIRKANDFRIDNGPTLAVSRKSTATKTTYEGSAYALRNFTKPYRLIANKLPTLHGGSNVASIKNIEYAHAELPFGSTTQLRVIPSEIESDIDCNDVVDPNDKVKLRYKLTNNPISYRSGKGDIFAPFSLYSSSVESGYALNVATNFNSNTDITNYHNDAYGDDKEIPIQGPFTEKYVGGREYRHVPIWTPSGSRPEAWNLNMPTACGDFSTTSTHFQYHWYPNVYEYAYANADIASLQPANSVSVSSWVKFSWYLSQSVVVTEGSGYKLWATRYGYGSRPGFQVLTGFEFVPPFWNLHAVTGAAWTPDDNNKWHHYVGTYDATAEELKLYVDGVLVDSKTVSSSINYTNLPFNGVHLGSNGGWGADAITGSMDETAIWNRALTSNEVTTIYNSGCPNNLTESVGPTGMVAWWRMGEGDTFPVIKDHIGINDAIMYNMSASDLEANAPSNSSGASLVLSSRTVNQPRSTILREPLAKRPVNIRNIRQTTGSTIIGNYSHDYEIIQTSGRKINNSFFVKNGGFMPNEGLSPYVPGLIEFQLPDYNKFGGNKYVFVERFNAPGGPDVSSRGVLDLNAEEFAAGNELNQRNRIVRDPLNSWYTDHCGQFGIRSTSGVGFRQPRTQNYNTLANYHKVNKNGASRGLYKSDYSREVEWVNNVGTFLDNFNRTLSCSATPGGWNTHYAESNQIVEITGYFELQVDYIGLDQWWVSGLSSNDFVVANPATKSWDFSFFHIGSGIVHIQEGGINLPPSFNVNVGDRLRIYRDKSTIHYQHLEAGSLNWSTIVTSGKVPVGNYYARAAFPGAGAVSISHARISNPRYDNWFIQHAIPQDELQYSWINASYDVSVDQPFGLLGSGDGGRTNFSVPDGDTNSIPGPEVQFISASNWKFPEIVTWNTVDGADYPVNFVNMLSLLPKETMEPYWYKYGLWNKPTSHNRTSPGWGSSKNITVSDNGKTVTKTTNTACYEGTTAAKIDLGTNGYLEFTTDGNPYVYVGFNAAPPSPSAQCHAPPPPYSQNMKYAIALGGGGQVTIWEDGVMVPPILTPVWAAGWKFRIVKFFNNIVYQWDAGTNGKVWTTFRESDKPVSQDMKLFPDVLIYTNGLSLSEVVITEEDTANIVYPGAGYWKSDTLVDPYRRAEGTINSYFNNLNGPYGYPSWKQIRTGETPVARYQKNNNIITVGPSRSGSSNGDGTFRAPQTPTSYVEPLVTFRNKPLITGLINANPELSNLADQTVVLRHSYGNNLGFFANESLTADFNLPSAQGVQPGYFDPRPHATQMQDLLHEQYSRNPDIFKGMKYSEIVYPREVNTGLKKSRQRTQYAEVADGTPIYSDGKVIFVSASLSDGVNGIDRGPLYRRTFWKDNPIYRNRREGWHLGDDGATDCAPYITGTLLNSQGHRDGHATSVNSWGTTPIVFYDCYGLGQTNAGTTKILGCVLDSYVDTGELNSADYAKITGYVGFDNSTVVDWPLAAYCVTHPTASAYYYHREMYRATPYIGPFSQGVLRWRVAELSGKNPWFDTYEDYAQDIRGIGKNFTIVPEFGISNHMEYYSDGRFKKQNDKFLTLDGADITCSADVEKPTTGIVRGFDKEFFAEYSNTDFEKYFGKFSADYDVDNISLKCNAVKKLLPYHGFYPAHRSLQLASMLSQSIAPYIGGISWSAGENLDPTAPPSGALAVQSLLQPYYAPGILYNTIKSGIAVDWGAHTGSVVSGNDDFNTWLGAPPNYRIPFEALLDPLGDVGIPVSASDGKQYLNLLYPTYMGQKLDTTRQPYCDLEDSQRTIAHSQDKYTLYKLAINNFLAEIPNFFLQNNELKSIVSNQQGSVTLTSGTVYYMNVFLEKDKNIIMIEDHLNGQIGYNGDVLGCGAPPFNIPAAEPLQLGNTHRSLNGKFFGPAHVAGCTGSDLGYGNIADCSMLPSPPTYTWGYDASRDIGDPAYAPYTPPYFYGKSSYQVKYIADQADQDGNFTFKKLFEKAEITSINPEMDRMFELIGGLNSPAKSGSMTLSSSFNLFGLFQEKQTTLTPEGALKEVINDPHSDLNKWVISPKMETPVLNFASQPDELGYGRGMWSGYGQLLTSSRGITFGIEETFKGTTINSCENDKIGWHSDVDVSVVYSDEGSTVMKTGGGSGWNAGAAGGKPIEPGDYWQFTIDQENDGIIAGLNTASGVSPDYVDMQYAIQTRNRTTSNATWVNQTNVTVVDAGIYSAITKNSVASAWDASTTGDFLIEVGGYWEFEISNLSFLKVGLDPIDGGEIDYHLYFDGVDVRAYEEGVLQNLIGNYFVGDKFRIFNDRSGYVVYWVKKSGPFSQWQKVYTSPTAVSTVLFPMAEFYAGTAGTPSEIINAYRASLAPLAIYENGAQVGLPLGSYEINDQLRLFRDQGTVRYQHSTGSSNLFETVYSSTESSIGMVLYPDLSIYTGGDSISEATQYSDKKLCFGSGSLLQKCFGTPESKQIGEIATEKEISEAIVAIPFTTEFVHRSSRFAASTTRIMGKHLFGIKQAKFDAYREIFLTNKFAEFESSHITPSVSIQKMLTLMDKYVIPPELDFLTYASGDEKIHPFVMYLFEFNHTLKDQDLADIWQGVMPDISRVAQLSDPDVDNNIFSHPTGPEEFFHGKNIPDDIRWMVFKVKRKANWNYYKMTADTRDDAKFDFKFSVDNVEIPYSYNWPYDYFSLVELAQIEVEDNFVKKIPSTTTEFEEKLTPLDDAIASGSLKTQAQVEAERAAATNATTTTTQTQETSTRKRTVLPPFSTE